MCKNTLEKIRSSKEGRIAGRKQSKSKCNSILDIIACCNQLHANELHVNKYDSFNVVCNI